MTRLTFAGATAAIECEGPAAHELLRFVWSRHLVSEPESAVSDGHADISFRSSGGRFLLSEAGRHDSDLDGAAALDVLLERGTHALTRAVQCGLLLHAAVVARGSTAILCPGLSGAGKSTLAMRMTRDGYDYITDELAFLAADTAEIEGLARPLCFKASAADVLAGAFPLGLEAAGARRSATGVMLPPDTVGRAPAGPCEVAAIVFPVYAPATALALTPVTSGDAAIRLMSTLINTRALERHGLADVGRLARQFPAFELTGSDFAAAPALISAAIQR